MSKTAIQLLSERLRTEQEKRVGSGKKNSGDSASYAFWDMPDNTTATLRFLPDADPDNPFFWRKREVIRLPFAGQIGGDYPTDQQVTVTVPCVDMFGDTCPIIAETRPWWKQGPEKEALARMFYKKVSFLFQGFVVHSPFEEKEVPENPIRRFVINKSIYEIIEKSLMNPEMEDMPTDYQGGRDFKIAKNRKGEYANYSTSSWSFRTRALGETEMVAIEQHGLFNLMDFLGPRPDADGIQMIKEMFHDSLAGKPFDFAAYGRHYRAYGARGSQFGGDQDAVTSIAQSHSASPRVAEDAEEEPAAQSVVKPQAADILARIKAKQTAKQV